MHSSFSFCCVAIRKFYKDGTLVEEIQKYRKEHLTQAVESATSPAASKKKRRGKKKPKRRSSVSVSLVLTSDQTLGPAQASIAVDAIVAAAATTATVIAAAGAIEEASAEGNIVSEAKEAAVEPAEDK